MLLASLGAASAALATVGFVRDHGGGVGTSCGQSLTLHPAATIVGGNFLVVGVQDALFTVRAVTEP